MCLVIESVLDLATSVLVDICAVMMEATPAAPTTTPVAAVVRMDTALIGIAVDHPDYQISISNQGEIVDLEVEEVENNWTTYIYLWSCQAYSTVQYSLVYM